MNQWRWFTGVVRRDILLHVLTRGSASLRLSVQPDAAMSTTMEKRERGCETLILKWVSGTVVLQLSAEKFGQGFHRFDVSAKDFERGKDRDREDDTRDSPHPAPENQGKKN